MNPRSGGWNALPANNRECVSRRLERYDEGGARRGDVETRLGVATLAERATVPCMYYYYYWVMALPVGWAA
jgi:hypothetical protein